MTGRPELPPIGAGTPTGCPQIRSLIEKVQPTLSLHGHMHHPAAARIDRTNVLCLNHVRTGHAGGAVAILRRNTDGTIDRLL